MTIDDIYFAAINGETQKLEAMLKTGEVDLNQMIDGGVNNGVQTKFTVLFSVLNVMSNNKKYHFDVLDLLLAYGADCNAEVELKSDAYTLHIPYFVYAVKTWKSMELMEYLLMRGMYPNLEQWESYADGHRESYPLLYFAITLWPTADLLQLMLSYGADPDRRILAYVRDRNVNQTLPPLFYALIDQKSKEKTALLFRYGANADAEVRTGYGMPQQFKFQRYVHQFYGGFNSMMVAAYKEGTAVSPLRKKVIPLKKIAVQAAPVEQAPEVSVPAEMESEKLAAAAVRLIRFDYENYAAYRYAVANAVLKDGSIFTLKKRKAEAEAAAADAAQIARQREELVKQLNAMADRQKTPINQWWNSFNGLTMLQESPGHRCPVWMPFERVVERPNGLSLASMFTENNDTLTGQEIQAILNDCSSMLLYAADILPDESYTVAEICNWIITDATYVYETTASEASIQSDLNRYNEALDDRERFWNSLDGHFGKTVEQRYYSTNMQPLDYYELKRLRQERYDAYEQRLRNTTYTGMQDMDQYNQYIEPIGILILDAKKQVAAIFLYESKHESEHYKVNFEKVLFSMRRSAPCIEPDEARRVLLQNLRYYPMPQINPVLYAPQGMDETEWVQIIYAANSGEGFAKLKKLVAEKYRKAGNEKRNTINANSPLFM